MIADVLVQAATQFLFACLGLLVLVALGADDTLARLAALGLGIAALMLGGFFMAQRSGGQQILRWAVRPLTRWNHQIQYWVGTAVSRLQRGPKRAAPIACGCRLSWNRINRLTHCT